MIGETPQKIVPISIKITCSHRRIDAFIQILKSLADVGYTLTPNFYKFEEYGVPQARHRILIVGIRNDLASQGIKFHVPAPTTPNPDDYVTAGEALTNPPIPADTFNNELTRHKASTIKMLSYIPEGGNAWSHQIPESLRLNVKGARLSNIYKRLDRNKPSYTVTGSGGGGTHMYHWKESRALTNRERARLQTFPDNYHFIGGKESVRKQTGMAIPPAGMRHILMAAQNFCRWGIWLHFTDATSTTECSIQGIRIWSGNAG